MSRFSFYIENVSDDISKSIIQAKRILKQKDLPFRTYIPYICLLSGIKNFNENPDKVLNEIMPKIKKI